MSNPLHEFLHTAPPAIQEQVARKADTSVSYLRQLAGNTANKRRPNVVLAVSLEAATRAAHAEYGTPVVTVIDIARMFS